MKLTEAVSAIQNIIGNTSFHIQVMSETCDDIVKEAPLPILTAESQHATASKRIAASFTRGHYKKVKIDDSLSKEVFDRYIKQLDYSRNIFLASDVTALQKYSADFHNVFARGKLSAAYDIYNLNIGQTPTLNFEF